MDYDDDEFQLQNPQLAAKASSKPPPEDSQWIEEYSRARNVCSEATSSEFVGMLLKSVGQVEGKAVSDQLDPSLTNDTVSLTLTKPMDPNLTQESQISVSEEKVDNTPDDVILEEPKKHRPGSSENVGGNVEAFRAIGLSENISTGAAEGSCQIKQIGTDVPVDGDTMTVESYTTNVEYVDHLSAETSNPSSENPSAETSIPFGGNLSTENSPPVRENPSTETNISFSENPTDETSIPFSGNQPSETSIPLNENPSTETNISFSEKPPAESSISFSESSSQISKLKDPSSQKSGAGSLSNMSPTKISSTDENETGIEKDAQQIISDTSMVSSSNLPETGSESSGPMQVDCKIISSEAGAVHLDEDDSSNEKNASLFHSYIVFKIFTLFFFCFVLLIAVSEQRSSPDTTTAENYEQPKSPIFGVSLVHQGSKDNIEVGYPSEGTSQNEISQAESVVASDSKNPSALVDKEASLDLAEKAVHQIDAHCVTPAESCNASQIEQESGTKNGSQDCLPDPKESMIEVSKSNKQPTFVDVARPSDGMKHGSFVPSKTVDDVENKVQSVSLGNVTPEEKNLTIEINKRADLGQDGKGSISYPTYKVTNLPKITVGPSKDSSSSQMDPKKFHDVSVGPQNPSGLTSQTGVKGKTDRKPRRKSVGKESAKKGTPLARDLVRGEITPVLLTPPATSQVTRFEEVKYHENATKPGAVLQPPKIPDLNNSTSMFQKPFTDNQQVQLRAQILVYGSLISGSPPEESHMVAAFGQSDGVRIWEGVWRACLERLNIQKSQPKPSTPIQSRSDTRDAGSRSDQVIKQASVQNKIPSSPIGGPNNKGTPQYVSPMIPFSSPLWSPTTFSDSLQSSAIAKAACFDFHQTLSPLRPTFQTPPVPNYNSSWLTQGPFSGQWLAASPIPTFNPTPHFPSLPITESVKLTPAKESGGSVVKHTSNPPVLSSSPIIFPEASSMSGVKRSTVSSDQPSSESKSRKKKKGIEIVGIPCSTPVAVSMSAFMTSKTPYAKSGDQNVEKVEESKIQAKEATEHADNAMFHCKGVWSQVERRWYDNNLNSNDEAKLVSSAVSLAAAASVAKVAAAAAKIASDVAEQARLMVNSLNNSQNLASASSKRTENLDAIVKASELAAEAVSQAGKIVAMSEPFSLKDLVEGGPEGYWMTPQLASRQHALVSENLNIIEKRNTETAPDKGNLATSSSGDLTKNRKGPEVLKTIGAVTESEDRPTDTSIVGQPESKVSSGNMKESDVKEGCLVEVYKDDDKYKRAWFGANVLSLKDGKALVSYTDIQSNEGSRKLKEWLPLEVEGSEVPKIRLAHPVTTMQGTTKRRRTASTDFLWSSGDRVDAWMQNHWREGVVMETNKLDATSLTVKFPGGETLVVRSWFVRPPLIWKDDKWVMCQTSEKRVSSPGNMQQEKRLKLGSPIMDGKRKPGPSENIDVVDPRKQEGSRPLSLSTQESVFNIGSTKDNKISTNRTMRSGLQKEGPRVTFGVPKPGKNKKFMDVSRHYVADGSNVTPHDSIKFTRYLIPHPPGSRGWKNSSRNDPKAVESKPQMLKSRKPPVPSVRALSAKSTANKSSLDSVSDGEKPTSRSGSRVFFQY
ncbi:protein SWOLLEN 1-like [Bidens hawaiensis]|uniref:protein SWOLLEN 1-like n=1 Tax=Bidens hawaiensis TaxID=980011 RepID=UPI00404943FE